MIWVEDDGSSLFSLSPAPEIHYVVSHAVSLASHTLKWTQLNILPQ